MRANWFQMGTADIPQAAVAVIDHVQGHPKGDDIWGLEAEIIIVLMRRSELAGPRRFVEPFGAHGLDVLADESLGQSRPCWVILIFGEERINLHVLKLL